MRDSTFWDVTVPRVMNIYATAVFLILWVGFILALILNRGWLDLIWQWVQALPLVPRIIVWLVFLPIMVGLWAWESSWPLIAQLGVLVGLVVWTILALYSFIRYVM